MEDPTLHWAKIAAIGQVAGAIATAAAAMVSLWIAFHGRKPRLKLTVGKRLVVGTGRQEPDLLMFNIANAGERPVHINGIGWETGWLRWGPKFLVKQFAIQLTGVAHFGSGPPPFEIQPGAEVSTYALMDDVLAHARDRGNNAFFTRDWPLWNRRPTRVRAYAYTADGHKVIVKPERGLMVALANAEVQAKAGLPG